MKIGLHHSGNIFVFFTLIFLGSVGLSPNVFGKVDALYWQDPASESPYVTGINIADGATGVGLHPTISSSNVYLPNAGIDGNTLTNSSVKLYQVDGDQLIDIPSSVGTSGGFDVVSLSPDQDLLPNTTYRFVVTSELKDQQGVAFDPFSSSFTTGSGGDGYNGPIAFVDPETVASGGNGFTSILIGPDDKFYGLTSDGIIKRWDLDHSTGLLSNETLFTAIWDAEGGDKRLSIGMCFDPASTAENLVLWVTHTSYGFADQPDFQGKVSRLSGEDFATVEDYVTHLPRSKKDHATNGLSFGPDGALYILQGANTAMGTYDNAWQRNDVLLSASMLRLDLEQIANGGVTLPIDAQTEAGNEYNPYEADAPLTLFATGIRNAYDMVWHSNGQLYVPTNGSAGFANAPGSDPSSNNYLEPQYQTYDGPEVPYTTLIPSQNDYVFRVEEGGYYGHPNPRRAQYVLNGGNPTNPQWPESVVDRYPEGTDPDADYRGYSVNLGQNKSPNGVIEYKSNAFNGTLKGKMLNTYFTTGDVVVLGPAADGNQDIEEVLMGIPGLTGYNHPLDVIEDTLTGNIYISEYQTLTRAGEGKITLLKPSIPPAQTEEEATVMINFQDEDTETPEGYLKDYGQAYGEKTVGDTAITYGWLKSDEATPLDLTDPANGRKRDFPEDNILLSTFVHMQGSDINDGGTGTADEAVWGISVPNGIYNVIVSVGDSINLGNIMYQVNAEGVPVIDQFDPKAGSGRFYTDSATVAVTDGVLNLDAIGGRNTKINVVTIKPGDPAQVAPSLDVSFNYAENKGNYNNQVTISAQAYVKSPNADSVAVSYMLINGEDTVRAPYTELLTVNQPGNYTLIVTATDNTENQNQTVVTRQFNIVTPAGGQIALENMNKIPGTEIGYPADDWYAFHKNLRSSNNPASKYHDVNVMRISNAGTGSLTITGFEITDPARFEITAIDSVPFTDDQLPLVLEAGGQVDVTLTFIEDNGGKGVREETLIIQSNAENSPAQEVKLKGTFMRRTEGGYEVNTLELFDLMGLNISMNGQPKPGSNIPSDREVNIGYHGDLILSSVFEQADTLNPIRVFQLASFKTQGTQIAKIVEVENDNVIDGFQFQIDNEWYQTIFPVDGSDTTKIAGRSIDYINRPFRVILDDYPSSGGNPSGNFTETVTGVKVYKVSDRDGNIIPYHYVFLQDYVQNGCGAGTANCDWNDGLYYFINVKPVNDPFVAAAIPDTLVNRGDSFDYATAFAFDQGYAGNKLTYFASMADGTALPEWVVMDTTTGILSGRMPDDGVNDYNIRVMAYDLNGIELYNQDSTLFSISSDSTVAGSNFAWLEAECASAGSYWNIVQDSTASAGYYATITSGLNSVSTAPVDEAGYLTFSFDLSDSGQYHLFTRAFAETQDDNTFWLKVDSSEWQLYEVGVTGDQSFVWSQPQEQTWALSNGDHILQIAYAEDGFALDKIYLSLSDTLPTGVGGAGCAGKSILLSNRVVETGSETGTVVANISLLNNTGTVSFDLIEGVGNNDNSFFSIEGNELIIASTIDNNTRQDYTIYVQATDAEGNTYQRSFTIRVTEGSANQPPVLNRDIEDQVVVVNQPYSYMIPEDLFSDPDEGDSLAYTVLLDNGDALPDWLTYDDQTRTLAGTPLEGELSYQIRITAIDNSGASVSGVFSLTVNATGNSSPVVANPIPDQSIPVGEAYSYTVSDSTFTDADGDALVYTASMEDGELPAWLTFNAETLTFSGTPETSDTVDITVSVEDPAGEMVSDVFTLVINSGDGENQAPTIGTVLSDQVIAVDVAFEWVIPEDAFVDADGDSLTYSLSLVEGSLPAWLSYDSESKTLSGTPTEIDTITLVVTATDTEGASATQSFSLIVSDDVTGIGDELAEDIRVYPNPVTQGELFISFDMPLGQDDVSYYLWSVEGKLLGHDKLRIHTSEPALIRVETLTSGMYVLELISNDFIVRKNIVIQ